MEGPHEVVEVVNRMYYKVDVVRVIKMYHANILKQYVDRQTVRQTVSRISVAEMNRIDKHMCTYY